MTKNAAQITELLNESRSGDHQALEHLTSAVYRELHKIARAYMRKERASHTLQPTALVSEAYLRLFQGAPVQWESRTHFYRVAARVMRHVLLDHARKRDTKKRGDAQVQVSFDESLHHVSDEREPDIVALDRALTQLTSLEPRLGQVVELRYFGGLDIEQTAEALDCSTGTIKRDWQKAKLWLRRAMAKS
jgi:RNA polymerase sigma factor (TIGR02999 family)